MESASLEHVSKRRLKDTRPLPLEIISATSSCAPLQREEEREYNDVASASKEKLLKRFEKRSAAGKSRMGGTRTMGMALTIGAALVGPTCGMEKAHAGWEPTGNESYGTAATTQQDAVRTAPGQSDDPGSSSAYSWREFRYVDGGRMGAPETVFAHTFTRSGTVFEVSAPPGTQGTARVNASFNRGYFFREQVNGALPTGERPNSNGQEYLTSPFGAFSYTARFTITTSAQATATIPEGGGNGQQVEAHSRSESNTVSISN